MTGRTRIKTLIPVGLMLALLAGAAPAAADGDWRFAVTPYLWLPTTEATLQYELPPDSGEGRFDVEVGPSDLEFAFMLAGEARRGRLVLASDIAYLDLSTVSSEVRSVDFGGETVPVEASLNTATDSSLQGLAWTIAAGVSLTANPDSPVDVFGGVRYLTVEAATDWELAGTVTSPGGSHSLARSGNVSAEVDLWDVIIGFRGRAQVAERWHVPFYLDVGTGTVALTWQGMIGVSRSYSWGDIGVVYRHLDYEQEPGELLHDFSLSGPAVTAAFRF